MTSEHKPAPKVRSEELVAVDEARKRLIEAQKQVERELREMRKKVPHTHEEDHRVVINI